MFKKFIGLALLTGLISSVQANVVILGTRVVYPEEQGLVSVQLTNKGQRPSLVQSWLDNGNEKADPKTLKLPFVITPPVSRIDPQKQQTLRVKYTGQALPKDRESLFFFNVLDIPPKPSKADLAKNPNYLQFSVRSRLKFFFRPANLPYSVSEAYGKVDWKVSGNKLTVNNPTPYHLTYSYAKVVVNGKSIEAKDADMVAPFSRRIFTLKANASQKGVVEWAVINDFGGETEGKTILK